ncbi:helix-turn-helix domain-containing protein [Marinactinospora rubrisoli]|uniref:Helix-turn-helix domain-containing protein n=1 Tax=Marinactinospora rubrisoli TaxID=2715399 RepID=A0ABW2KPP7_9ACTN
MPYRLLPAAAAARIAETPAADLVAAHHRFELSGVCARGRWWWRPEEILELRHPHALLTRAETAAVCGVRGETVRRWARAGLIEADQIGRQHRYPAGAVVDLLRGARAAAAASPAAGRRVRARTAPDGRRLLRPSSAAALALIDARGLNALVLLGDLDGALLEGQPWITAASALSVRPADAPISVCVAADLLGVPEAAVHQMILDGRLTPGICAAGRRRLLPGQLRAALDRTPATGRTPAA